MGNESLKELELMIVKVQELIDSIDDFSSTIPDSENYYISNRLKNCVREVPNKLLNSFQVENNADQIRLAIKAAGALSECKDYLYLVENLSYGKTKHLISQVDDINDLLFNRYPNLKFAG